MLHQISMNTINTPVGWLDFAARNYVIVVHRV